MLLKILRLSLCFIVTLVFSSGCVPQKRMDELWISLNPKQVKDKQEIARVKQVISEINYRNKTIEKSPEWLEEAYSSLKIKRLNDIPINEYKSYKGFVNGSGIYIIVHPAFYTFFHTDMKLSTNKDILEFPSKNIVERFYGRFSFYDMSLEILKEQERMLRDFLELMSTEKKLMLLIIPGGYREHLSYGYIEGRDEYARYINEITNMSESVLYLESVSFDMGHISRIDMEMLRRFLKELDIKTVMLGGGYVGKCLDQFYTGLIMEFEADNVYYVAEITAVSPENLNNKWGRYLLTKKGRINVKEAAINLLLPDAYELKRTLLPKVKVLRRYNFYYRQEPQTPDNKESVPLREN